MLSGIKPVVVAVVVEAILRIGSRAINRHAHGVIAAAAFVAIYFFHVPFPVIVVAAAIIGLLGSKFWSSQFVVVTAKESVGGPNEKEHQDR